VAVSDFASLLIHIRSAYKLEEFVIKYFDEDGDRVSLASTEEFDEAIKAGGGKMLKLLIFVPKSLQERKQERESSTSRSSSSGSNSNSKDDDGDKVEDEEEEPRAPPPTPVPARDPFDHGVDCEGCGKRIIGTLYQCTVCRDVSVCVDCEEKNVHDTAHTLLKVRVPASSPRLHPQNAERKAERAAKKWGGCCKWKKVRMAAVPLILIAVLRHLPLMLCLLAMWGGCQILRKRRCLLQICSECTHKEGCRVGKAANRAAKGGQFCGLIPKILCVILCLFLRALPCWLLVVFLPVVFCVCRKLRRLRKGVCKNNLRGRVDAMCGQYKDILQMGWPQLWQRVQQNQAPRGGMPQSVMGCAAVAASESLAASVAAVVALSESVAAGLGVTIPVAVPVNAAPYAHQISVLKEMGFEDTAALQQLLVKHSGNIQAVISDVMQLKPKQN